MKYFSLIFAFTGLLTTVIAQVPPPCGPNGISIGAINNKDPCIQPIIESHPPIQKAVARYNRQQAAKARRYQRRNPIPRAGERSLAISNRGVLLHDRGFFGDLWDAVTDVVTTIVDVVTVALPVLTDIMDIVSYGWLGAVFVLGRIILKPPPQPQPGGEHLGAAWKQWTVGPGNNLIPSLYEADLPTPPPPPPPPPPAPAPVPAPHPRPPPDRRPCPRCALPRDLQE
ncbi:hypothetical protein BP6252_02203 [Coleophoma cylindrospora]|uniref:Uncharacterized protein n=1 Tax=Coleophoma cylindrospora TaxID=1849047 RepID=A0A3D8SE65_9HELO|nr:hypothetical protein BP6252_02203 [Coleophoma cylindrospora]